MASRKQAVRISTPSVEQVQALFDLGSAPRHIADEFGSPLDLFNTAIIALQILVDTALTGSHSAKDFLAELVGARVDEDVYILYEQVVGRADSLYEAAIKNSAEAQRDLHSMAEQLVQGFSSFSTEYPRYVAENWQ